MDGPCNTKRVWLLVFFFKDMGVDCPWWFLEVKNVRWHRAVSELMKLNCLLETSLKLIKSTLSKWFFRKCVNIFWYP